MTISPGSVRYLYSHLVNSVHGDARLDVHDSLSMPINAPAISRLRGSLFSEE